MSNNFFEVQLKIIERVNALKEYIKDMESNSEYFEDRITELDTLIESKLEVLKAFDVVGEQEKYLKKWRLTEINRLKAEIEMHKLEADICLFELAELEADN